MDLIVQTILGVFAIFLLFLAYKAVTAPDNDE